MRNWILHIIYIGIWAAFAVSCSSVLEDEIPNIDCPTDKDERVNLTFTLVLGEQSSASRAAWSEGYENLVGSVAENTINSLQVLLFSEDGNTCYGPLEQTEFFPINQEKSIYEFTGSIPLNAENACIEDDKLNCKIMVLANSQVQIANAATAVLIKAVLEACEYTYSTLSPNPMWGVSTISNQPVIKGWGTELDPIYVLRSLAKIEVNLSQSLKDAGYTLDAVTLTKHNTKGYCLPNGYYTTIDGQTIIADKTKDLDQEGVLHAYNSSVTTNELSFTGSSNNGYIVYVPEYEMQESEDDPTIKLLLKKGTETILIDGADPALYFKNYDETTGKPTGDIFNIVRNHWYKYLIKEVNDGLSANLTVKANDWTPDDETWNYTEVVTIEKNMTWTSSNRTDTDENVTVVYEETKDVDDKILTKVPMVYIPWATSEDYAECTFKITAPVGATWIANFETIEGAVGAFRFLNENNEQISQMTGKVGTDTTLKIVTALSDRTETRKAKLVIGVQTLDGRIIRVDNLIAEQDITEKEFTLVQPKNN